MDEFAGIVAKPISHKGYIYVHDDPINKVDPDGHWGFSFSSLWEGIKSAASWVEDKVDAFVERAQSWVASVRESASNAWNSIKSTYRSAKSYAKRKLSSAKRKLATAKRIVKKYPNKATVTKVVSKAAQKVAEKAKPVLEKAKELGEAAGEKVVKALNSKPGQMAMAGLEMIGGAGMTLAGAALTATGAGVALGVPLMAHGVNTMISGGANAYFAATDQNDKIGSVNLLRDYVYKGALGDNLGEKVFNIADNMLGSVGGETKLFGTAVKNMGKLGELAGKFEDTVNVGKKFRSVEFSYQSALEKDIGKTWQKIWTGKDKYVPELANAIEEQFPKKITAVEREIFDSTGQLITDLDIELGNLVIQVKSDGAKGLTGQMIRTANATGKTVISFTPNIKQTAAVLKGVRMETK